MFVTFDGGRRKSITGRLPATDLDPAGTPMVGPDPEPIPLVANIKPGDQRTGVYGGLLYNCAPRDTVGLVMFAHPSPYREVIRADCESIGPVLGVIVRKPSPTVCEIVHAGPAPCFFSLVPGQRYFLGPEGTLAPNPLTDTETLYVHFVGTATSATTLMVQPTYPLIKRAR